MRRTRTTVAVALELLADPHGRWSYEIADKLGTDRGSVSTILLRMLKKGWLTHAWEQVEEVGDKRRPRHIFAVNGDGLVGLRDLVNGREDTGNAKHSSSNGGYPYVSD